MRPKPVARKTGEWPCGLRRSKVNCGGLVLNLASNSSLGAKAPLRPHTVKPRWSTGSPYRKNTEFTWYNQGHLLNILEIPRFFGGNDRFSTSSATCWVPCAFSAKGTLSFKASGVLLLPLWAARTTRTCTDDEQAMTASSAQWTCAPWPGGWK